MKTQQAPKDRLFEVASRLFYQQGYRAVGVDTLAEESGIGKMTLYRHYPSKDGLIVAFLQNSDQEFWGYFEQITGKASSARGKLEAFFDSLQAYATTPACFGCPFLNVATEFPDADHPGHRVALSHKQVVRGRFLQLAREAGAGQPEALADGLLLLMDGAYMAARMFGGAPTNPAAHLGEAARALIDAHCKVADH
jgi:AcrR family transcriptional regulator